MPFANSYVGNPHDADEDRRDATRCFIALAGFVVRRPLSTFIFRAESPEGKKRFLIVDRDEPPCDGGSILLATKNGLKEARYDASIPVRRIWGTVVWFLEEA